MIHINTANYEILNLTYSNRTVTMPKYTPNKNNITRCSSANDKNVFMMCGWSENAKKTDELPNMASPQHKKKIEVLFNILYPSLFL